MLTLRCASTLQAIQRKALLALVASAVVGLLCVAVIFFSLSSASPAITARHVSSVPSGNRVSATFEIINRTGNSYAIYPTAVEALNGASWQQCFQFSASFPSGSTLVAEGSSALCTYVMTNLPSGSPLRLSLNAGKEATGVVGLLERLELRFVHGQTGLSLNPFDKKTRVFRRAVPIFSENFQEPSFTTWPGPKTD